MAGPTNIEEQAILDTRLDRTGVYTLALFTTTPADDGTGGVEVSTSSTGYARININASSSDLDAAVAGAPSTKKGPSSGKVWAFGPPTANWGTITAAGVYEGSTLRYVATLTTPTTVNNGDPAPQFDGTHQITFQAGDPGDTF